MFEQNKMDDAVRVKVSLEGEIKTDDEDDEDIDDCAERA